jgi:hypothetical protein
MRILRPMVAGTIMSVLAGAAAGYLSPEPSGPLPPLSSWNHPLSAYQATVSAFGGNPLELFGITAGIFFACFIMLGREKR